jgi:N6-L-threonylcarbamoyladenine synthase
LLYVENYHKINLLGTTVDDAAGEAFDKVSKLLGFGYPGGPQIQSAADKGNENSIPFPVAELKHEYNFSFSGVKTAVLRYLQKKYDDINNIPVNDRNDIAASFQKAVVDALVIKCKNALDNYKVKSISVVGGVAANLKLRKDIENLAKQYNLKTVIPDLEYCGDNAAMIALRGKHLYEAGITSDYTTLPYPALPKNHFLQFNN